MLLAIDAGNTNIVFALVAGGDIVSRWRIATDPRRTADEYAVWLHNLMALEGKTPGDVEAVIVSTVVPRALHNLQVLASKYFSQEALIAGEPPVTWGVRLDIDEPSSLGADRAVNMIAAHALHPEDLIIIDFGTATTFDVADYKGNYKGGIICPGINLSLDALVSAAAKLPRIAIESPPDKSVMGTNTEDQMHIGVYWGYIAMIEGLVLRLREEIGRPAKVVSTGGLASLFDENTDIFDAIEPDLTIQGLWMLYERSR